VRNKLVLACEKAKTELSSSYEATIRVEGLIREDEFYEDLDFELLVTRDEFEEAGMEIFERLQNPYEEALQEC